MKLCGLVGLYMGSIFGSTTDFFRTPPSVAERLTKVFTPCVKSDGSRNITFKIFDQQGMVSEMNITGPELETELKTFLDGMRNTTGVEPAVATSLAAFTFNVTYTTSFPSDNEIRGFGVNDFPIYFLTPTIPFVTSTSDAVSLLIKHRLPEAVRVWRRQGTLPLPIVAGTAKPYEILEKDWEGDPNVLGFGLPGAYFLPNSQTRCRKVGIIKMKGGMKENLPEAFWRRKLVSVVRHEMGHMMGLTHEDGTLMAADYNVNFSFPTYTPDQIWVVSKALEDLTQN